MKKLIIAAAIVCAAVVANAAKINWAAAGLVDKNGVALNSSTLGDFTVVCTFFDSTGASLIQKSDSVNALGNATGSWLSTDSPAPATSTSYYAQMVLTDSEGNTLTGAKTSFSTTSSSTKSIALASSFSQTGSTHGWVVAPEPTSAMLLLLGMAGLALKRRRA